jgi:hypothetical protein
MSFAVGEKTMTRKAKIIIAILTFVVFVGVGFFESGQRADSIQHRAFAYEELCQDRTDPINRTDENCIRDFRRAVDESQSKAIMGAVPIAAGAAAIFLVLSLIFVRLRSRKADKQVSL